MGGLPRLRGRRLGVPERTLFLSEGPRFLRADGRPFSIRRLLGEPGGRLALPLQCLPAWALPWQWDLLSLAGLPLATAPQLPSHSAQSAHSWLQAHPILSSQGVTRMTPPCRNWDPRRLAWNSRPILRRLSTCCILGNVSKHSSTSGFNL